jgi:hypothetical protein
MSWNYRIIKTDGEFKSMPWKYWAIHEVYYDEAGNPTHCTKDPMTVGCDEGVETIRKVLEMMMLACDKPVLDMEIFKEKG